MTETLVERRYLLVKRGLYYGLNNSGYTGVKAHAGRYREIDALGLEGVTSVHEDKAPDFSPRCCESAKINYLQSRTQQLEDALRLALDTHDVSYEWEDAARAALGETG